MKNTNPTSTRALNSSLVSWLYACRRDELARGFAGAGHDRYRRGGTLLALPAHAETYAEAMARLWSAA